MRANLRTSGFASATATKCDRRGSIVQVVINASLSSRRLHARSFPSPHPSGRPANQPDKRLVEHAAGIDFRHRDLLLAQRQQHADPVGEPQMRIGQRPQLVLVVLERLMIGRLARPRSPSRLLGISRWCTTISG